MLGRCFSLQGKGSWNVLSLDLGPGMSPAAAWEEHSQLRSKTFHGP